MSHSAPRFRVLAVAAVGIAFLTAPPAARAELELGVDAPDVQAKDFVNTEPVTLKDLGGRVILLELFTTT